MVDESGKVMVQFHFDGNPPDSKAVATRFDIDVSAIDPDFGVIVTDEIEKLCAVLVPKDVAAKMSVQFSDKKKAEGSFSSPRIAPFGPAVGDEDGD